MITKRQIRAEKKALEKQIKEARAAVAEMTGKPMHDLDPGHPLLRPLYLQRRDLKALRKTKRVADIAMFQRRKVTMGLKLSKTVQYTYAEADNARLEAFYASADWKMMRYEALRLHGGKCQCCGSSPAQGKRLHVDHIKPLRVFWDLRLDLNNLQVLCEDCNEGKGARHADDWRPEPRGARDD